MSWRWFCSILFIGILSEVEFTHSAPAEVGKTKEKVRPYEFGFSIEEQQHRHEKRDENGIVMGEFGFITADGIYHVTVYATDENGKFKIISMKSYPYGKMEKKVMIARLPPATKKPAVTTKAPTTIKAMKPDGSSCGGCVLPKKSKPLPADVKDTKPEDKKAVFRPLSKDLSDEDPSTKSAPKSIGTSPAAGKGSSSSSAQKPGSQPLLPPKVTAPGAQKPNANGVSSPKKGTGASGSKEPSGNNVPQIDKRFGDDDDEVPSGPGKLIRPLNPTTPQNKISVNTDTNTNTQTSANGLITKNKITDKVTNSGIQSKKLSSEDGSSKDRSPEVRKLVKPLVYKASTTSKPSTEIASKNKVSGNSLTNQIDSPSPPVNPKSMKIPNVLDDPQIGRTESSITTGIDPSKSLAGFNQNTITTVQKQSNPTQTPAQIQKNTIYSTGLPEYPQGTSPTNIPGPLYSSTLPPNTTVQTTKVTKPKLTQNLINSFAIPVSNAKQGPSNTKEIKQTVTPLIKSTKQPKSFQTLSKILPEKDSIQKQTVTLPTTKTSNKKTQTAQPQSTGKGLTPTSLQPNTIGARTSTTNPQSTNQQASPKAPSTQSAGKTTNTAGGVGVSATSKGSGGSANAGGGGGPLYRFNYVLDYNSHREEGRVDGSKEGNYNTIDEDGIRRIIDYIANENGYQPHIKLQRLPPNEVPTGENKLKEYEFVWFN